MAGRTRTWLHLIGHVLLTSGFVWWSRRRTAAAIPSSAAPPDGSSADPEPEPSSSGSDTDDEGGAAARTVLLRTVAVLWFAVLLLGLREISAALSRVNSPGVRSFGMGQLTGWSWKPWDSEDTQAALSLWKATDDSLPQHVMWWASAHVGVDFVLLLSLTALLGLVFTRLRDDGRLTRERFPWIVLGLYAVSDLVEGVLTLVLLAGASPRAVDNSARLAIAVGVANDVKWLTLGTCVILVVAGLAIRDANRASPLRSTLGVASTLRVPLFVVLVLAVLLVMPGGGPLDQLPDLLRAEAEGSSAWLVPLSTPTWLVLSLAVVIWLAGLVASRTRAPWTPDREPARITWPFPVAWGVALILVGVSYGVWTATWPHSEPVPSLGMLVLPAVLCVGSLIALVIQAAKGPSSAAPSSKLDSVTDTARGAEPTVGRAREVGRALAALSVGVGGLALVRAYLPLVLVDPSGTSFGWLLFGVLATLAGPVLLWLVLTVLERLIGDRPRLVTRLSIAVLGVAAVPTVALGVRPQWADSFGLQGVVCLALLVVTLAVVLVDNSRLSTDAGPISRRLGFHTRPIFLTLLLVYTLINQADDLVNYHAARVIEPRAAAAQARTWQDEVRDWRTSLTTCLTEAGITPDALPMVLVAAPGGGIRAAYWTGSALDRLAEQECGREQVFLASGVSGGSVGLTVWAVNPDSPVDQLSAMAQPTPLTRSATALLLRDLPRGLLGVHPPWRDRAAVLEDAWIEADPRGRLGQPWPAVRQLAGTWTPHLVLNATDLQRGCAVLVTSLPRELTVTPRPAPPALCGLPPTPEPDTDTDSAVDAFAAGAIDARDLASGPEPCTNEGSDNQVVRIATAAMLSARFPIASPTGGMVSCTLDRGADPHRVLVGDGGYRENTGLDTLLQVWAKLAPVVADVPEGEPPVVPVFVLLDNHYRSTAATEQPGVEPEVVTVLRGAGAAQHPTAPGVMEQRAAITAAQACPATTTCWHVVAPSQRPSIGAPLGWALSQGSQDDLTAQLVDLPALQELTNTLNRIRG